MRLTLELLPVQFRFLALEPVLFPPGQPGNIIRGAFGGIFQRLVCAAPGCEARTCERRSGCPYLEIFDPVKPPGWPSGFANPPRGFVFRAHHLDGRSVPAGEEFHVNLHLFHRGEATLQYFVESFGRLSREGLGPGRGRVELQDAVSLGEDGLPRTSLAVRPNSPEGHRLPPLSLDLSPSPEIARKALVRFVTPTELKSGGSISEAPAFALLMARIRDRISALRALYGPGPLSMDFRGFTQRAELVRLVRCELRHVESERRSSRTGLRHPIGGFVGEAEYEGDLAEFLPYLRAARWTGVGRQTVWGKGAIEVSIPAA